MKHLRLKPEVSKAPKAGYLSGQAPSAPLMARFCGRESINPLNRIIDANINRAKEGLRVCEEITRFILDDRRLTSEIKDIRHEIDARLRRLPEAQELLKARKSLKDVGKTIYAHELKRKNLADIFFANIKRVQESIRVLEEFLKLKNINLAVQFKKIRYETYEIEKKVASRISALRHHR